MPNILDFTDHTKKRKGRPSTINVGADRSKYFKEWAEKNPEKIEKYRLKQRIRNRENAIQRMQLEIEGIKSILDGNDNGTTEENEETGERVS
jgi:hypothetical protein